MVNSNVGELGLKSQRTNANKTVENFTSQGSLITVQESNLIEKSKQLSRPPAKKRKEYDEVRQFLEANISIDSHSKSNESHANSQSEQFYSNLPAALSQSSSPTLKHKKSHSLQSSPHMNQESPIHAHDSMRLHQFNTINEVDEVQVHQHSKVLSGNQPAHFSTKTTMIQQNEKRLQTLQTESEAREKQIKYLQSKIKRKEPISHEESQFWLPNLKQSFA